jgi:Arc/MetJ-type ribon-helix-helix transcriptional regulator
MERESMAIELSVETQKRIEEKLKSGRYSSADELICAALDALNEFEPGAWTKKRLKQLNVATSRSNVVSFTIGRM